jgi:hypothetical protein
MAAGANRGHARRFIAGVKGNRSLLVAQPEQMRRGNGHSRTDAGSLMDADRGDLERSYDVERHAVTHDADPPIHPAIDSWTRYSRTG